MPFNNSPFGAIWKSPLVKPVFVESFNIGGNPAPPGSEFMITEAGDFMITQAADRMITE